MLPFLHGKGRILLLDDDAAIQRLVSHVLSRAGYRVDCVGHGNEAIARLARRRYDAVLLDLMMPHEGGMTVISHLRDNAPERLRRVLLVTGAPDSLLQSLEGQVFGWVRKPFEPAELVQAVERLIAA